MSAAGSTEGTPRIVVIDGDSATLELLSVVLTRHGYHVATSRTVSDAITILDAIRPEIVLMEYILPDMDGMVALRLLRDQYPDAAVVMLAAKGNEEIAVRLIKAGASEYLIKPFTKRTILKRIEAVLRMRSVEQSNKRLQAEREQLLREIESWNRDLQERVQERGEALQRAQAEIAQTEKLAALGYLAAGMAHEIRNPLNSIALFIQLLKQGDVDDEQNEYLDKTLKEVDRIDGIIRKLVQAANRSRTLQSDVRIDRIVQSALDVFSPHVEARRIAVKLRCNNSPPPLKADPTEIEQIFTNLFINALEEMPQGGTLDVLIDSGHEHICINVSDSGSGIDKRHLDSIFEPFFTTKPRGTGIGLPVVRRIARLYHGDVTVESTSPQGTTFKVVFPVSRQD